MGTVIFLMIGVAMRSPSLKKACLTRNKKWDCPADKRCRCDLLLIVAFCSWSNSTWYGFNGTNSVKGKRKRVMPRMDMTPMVDLAFLLLTFLWWQLRSARIIHSYFNNLFRMSRQPPGCKGRTRFKRCFGTRRKSILVHGHAGSEAMQTDFRGQESGKFFQKNQEIKDLYGLLRRPINHGIKVWSTCSMK